MKKQNRSIHKYLGLGMSIWLAVMSAACGDAETAERRGQAKEDDAEETEIAVEETGAEEEAASEKDTSSKQLTRMCSYNASGVLLEELIYSYDRNGILQSTVSNRPNYADYWERYETKTVYNADGSKNAYFHIDTRNVTSTGDGSSRDLLEYECATYQYDEDGRLTEMREYDIGNEEKRGVLSLDDLERMLADGSLEYKTCIVYSYEYEENEQGVSQYRYLPDGQLVERCDLDEAGEIRGEVYYPYEYAWENTENYSSGRRARVDYEEYSYERDAWGDVVHYIVAEDESGSDSYEFFCEYERDEQGNILRARTLDENKTVLAERSYEYDADGDLLERDTYNGGEMTEYAIFEY